MDSAGLRTTYRRFRAHLAVSLPVVAAALWYTAAATRGGWGTLWFVLSMATVVTALILCWRAARHAQRGRWWAWLGFLLACELLLMAVAAGWAVLAGEVAGFFAVLDSVNDQLSLLPGRVDDLDVAIPFGAAGVVVALGGISVLVPLGRDDLSGTVRELIGEAIDLLLVLVGAMALCVVLGGAALAGPSTPFVGAVLVSLVPLGVLALAVPVLVGVILRKVWQLLTPPGEVGHDAHAGSSEPSGSCR